MVNRLFIDICKFFIYLQTEIWLSNDRHLILLQKLKCNSKNVTTKFNLEVIIAISVIQPFIHS